MGDSSKLVACAFLCLIIISLPLYISAIIIAGDGMPKCSTTYKGINFNYDTWLRVYGITGLVGIGGMGLSLILAAIDKNMGLAMLVTLALMEAFWKLAWFVVGAVLLFTELAHGDCMGTRIWVFGLVLFILEIVTMCSKSGGSSQAAS